MFEVRIGISNRHIHLTNEVFNYLFESECKPSIYISQKGEFATDKYITLKGPKGIIPHVRVMGPCRNYNQVEIAKSDAFILGVNPPVAQSGKLSNATDITICYEDKEILLEKSCILAESHIHMNEEKAKELGLTNGQLVHVHINKERSGIIDAFIKVKDNGVLDFHIDRDQANAFLLENGDTVIVEKAK